MIDHFIGLYYFQKIIILTHHENFVHVLYDDYSTQIIINKEITAEEHSIFNM